MLVLPLDKLFPLLVFDHFVNNIIATHQFLVNEQHWESLPIEPHTDPLTDVLICEDIEMSKCGNMLQDLLTDFSGKAALGEARAALHKDHHSLRFQYEVDFLVSCQKNQVLWNQFFNLAELTLHYFLIILHFSNVQISILKIPE